MNPNITGQATHQYKPKTAITHRDEIIEPGEFYFLEIDRYLFCGRLRPGQTLTMRMGCLADIGDIVQLVHDDPTVCRVVSLSIRSGWNIPVFV